MIDLIQKRENKLKTLVEKLKELGQTSEGIAIYNKDTGTYTQLKNFNVDVAANNIYLIGQAFYGDNDLNNVGIDCIPIKDYTLTLSKIGLVGWHKENCGELVLEYLNKEITIESDDEVLWREEDEEHSKMESLAKVDMYFAGELDENELTSEEEEEVYRQYYTDSYKNQENRNNPNLY
ncbi:hypothetical protein [Clostridium sporogenes]|uniref:hypothetical protein n=1 Tax=Clostridium sporogenes TaxID=1509 RepID=UPI0013D77F38|nr:hypothetical protein [Clostridium sporogenes]MCW6124299.1 hypothetical protein [Clostridium sporogenes]NFT27046.1 hypothetical protein [Clostridium sporogenes]